MDKERQENKLGESLSHLIAQILLDNYEEEYVALAKPEAKFARKGVVVQLKEQLPNHTEPEALKMKAFINRLEFIDK